MATKLENLKPGILLKGVLPDGPVTVLSVRPYGPDHLGLVYRDRHGRVDEQLLSRQDEHRLEVVTASLPWSFSGDGALLRLASEALRIRLAHLFDPYLAVHTSTIEPLPHQITAVYERMLPRQPLRFLLADDPGAGKTIMAGLYIKELMLRGDLERCLVVCPGSLAEQWQDELWLRFQLPFEILTNDRIEAARTGNVFQEIPLLIARLDKLARDEALQERLRQVDWDLVVVDEAHKMSATFWSGEVRYTKRYRLGQLLSDRTRHFLLMTATPHNGKEEDFQLFLALLDPDRFEGRFREGVHRVDVSDLMRRMLKEQLLRFDGRPLFPERRAYTVAYHLSPAEKALYQAVTEYVREGFNRAEALANNGRRNTVGFALTILQRRLASSPEAIYQSLRRRRERLQARLEAETTPDFAGIPLTADLSWPDEESDWDEDLPAEERETLEEEVVDQATPAQTAEELRLEIQELERLEALAETVRRSNQDRKWDELRRLLLDEEAMFDPDGHRRKLVIFTEHRDTLNYLVDRIRVLLGKAEAVAAIHGGVHRDERRRIQEAFTHDKEVTVLVATDAAGEGINLQRAHLMINYDLPWNPNRLEQRFGRIHRIGQEEVCHLWNLVAVETREGDVYYTLLRKLDRERETLGGAVFDVLGKAVTGKTLRELLVEAIRYGDRPEVRARLHQVVDQALDRERLRQLLEERALARETMSPHQVHAIRREMERMEARRLQPHFIRAFFLEAFQHLGGQIREREQGRYEITHVPAVLRRQRSPLSPRETILQRYQRVCFEKAHIQRPGKPQAAFLTPGHPLLAVTIDQILAAYGQVLTQGAVLVDDNDPGETPRLLFYLEQTIQDARTEDGRSGEARAISRRLHFVETRVEGDTFEFQDAGYAPYLDYRPPTPEEAARLQPVVARIAGSQNLEDRALTYAITHLVPRHLEEVRRFREPLIAKTEAAVKERLTAEIAYWDRRAAELKAQEAAGKVNARLNSAMARRRADELEARLRRRLEELERERHIMARPPRVVGGALVIPGGLLRPGGRTAHRTSRQSRWPRPRSG
ncbi:MAG: RNA helicase [Litorilinea sp.]|nr:MAG: RNA helicase [Litorilinea sp.]